MAYSISGFCRDSTNAVISVECYYQFLFVKKNPDSSPTVWSEIYESVAGYYSHDLADGDMLKSEGNFSEGDHHIY